MCADSHAQAQIYAHSHAADIHANVAQKAHICAYSRQVCAHCHAADIHAQNVTQQTYMRKISRSRHTCAIYHAEGTYLRTLSTDIGTLSRKKKDMRILSRNRYRHTHTVMQQTYIYVRNLKQQTNMRTLSRSRHRCTYTHMYQSDFFGFVSAGAVQEGDAGKADQL